MKKLSFIFLALIIISTFIVPKPVYALTQNLAIQSEGSETDGLYVGGAGDYTNLNSNDDNLSYLRSTSSPFYTYHSYNMQNYVGSNDISNVRITYRIEINASSEIIPYVLIGGTKFYKTTRNTVALWTTYTDDWAVNPATGLAWTAAQINAAEFGFKMWDSGTSSKNTYMLVTVTYTLTTPTVTTNAATDVGYVAPNHIATLNGSITDTGGENEDYYGWAYGTTANATVPAITEAPHNGTYGASWTSGAGSYDVNDYEHDLVGLVSCSTYYCRFAAHNSMGWSWGSEVTFTTLCDPDITTQAATYIGATTARLNSLVVNDGGQPCDVRFLYSTVSGNCTDDADCTTGSCNATTYNGTTPWILDTYTTGQQPYVDLSGLVINKTYYFCVQIRNDVSCRCGGELSFTTSATVLTPTNLKGIAGATTLSLFWIKGVGSTNTLVRGKLNTYPTSIADGDLWYFDSKSSVLVPNLLQGTTYYIMAWSESGGIYSTSNATLILTTLGTVPGNDIMVKSTTPTNWLTAPDYTNVSNMPWYGVVNWWADSFDMQRSTLWFLCAMTISLAVGILVYWKGGHKVLIADVAVMICIGLFAAMKLTPYWLLMPFIIFAVTAIVVGERA